MPKALFKRLIPSEKVRNNPQLGVFGKVLFEPNLWHINRRSISGAFAVGLFMAWVPVPFQMLLAAGTAILFRVNLPLSVALVWITNPLTMPPMFYLAYLVGAWASNTEALAFEFELSYEWLGTMLGHIWLPFLLGCLIFAIGSSVLGYLAARMGWRWHVARAWKRRSLERG